MFSEYKNRHCNIFYLGSLCRNIFESTRIFCVLSVIPSDAKIAWTKMYFFSMNSVVGKFYARSHTLVSAFESLLLF